MYTTCNEDEGKKKNTVHPFIMFVYWFVCACVCAECVCVFVCVYLRGRLYDCVYLCFCLFACEFVRVRLRVCVF